MSTPTVWKNVKEGKNMNWLFLFNNEKAYNFFLTDTNNFKNKNTGQNIVLFRTITIYTS